VLINFFMATNLRFNKKLVDKSIDSPSIGAIFYPHRFITLLPHIIVRLIL
jgi:hypothetical protein